MAKPLTIAAPASNFYLQVDTNTPTATAPLFNDGDLQYAVLPSSAKMVPIVRTAEEFFSTFLVREVGSRALKVACNANPYGLTKSGYADVVLGHDPVPASATTPEGQVIRDSVNLIGSSEPNRFHVLNANGVYVTGFGDPPASVPARPGLDPPLFSAIGGLGPVIIRGLPFGDTNQYSAGVPAGAPSTGVPGAAFAPFLIQRSNKTYTAYKARGLSSGKVVIAHSSSFNRVFVLVQADGPPTGIGLDQLRDKLLSVAVDDAVFLDGSDSATLFGDGSIAVTPGNDKDETIVVGVGFQF